MRATGLLCAAMAAAGAVCASAAPRAKPKARPAAPPSAAVRQQAIRNDAATLMALLRRAEERRSSGRWELSVERRFGDVPAGRRPEDIYASVKAAAPESVSRASFAFLRGAWRLELPGDPSRHDRIVIGFASGTARALEESVDGQETRRTGSIGRSAPVAQALTYLADGFAPRLIGVNWTSLTREKERVRLAGNRGPEAIHLVLRTTPEPAVELLRATQELLTPRGRVVQGVEYRVDFAAAGRATRLVALEEIEFAGEPLGQFSATRYRVERGGYGEKVSPEELEVPFPPGTRVTDSRGRQAARYVQGDRDPTPEELKALREAAGATVVKVGSPAPLWELKDLDGKQVRLADFRGKVVVLTWFASWCGPCAAEAPRLEKNVWQKYRDRGVVVIGLNAGEQDDPARMAREFVRKHGVTSLTVLDVDGEAMAAYQASAFPTLAVIDGRGMLRYIQAGYAERAVIQAVEEALRAQ